MIEERLEAYLKAMPALSDVRGYFAFIITDRTKIPGVTYFRVDTQRDYAHSGEDRHKEARLQVTLWAATYGQAKTLGKAMVAALAIWTGVYSDVTIHNTEMLDERDLYEEEPKLYGVMVDVSVSYTA